MVEQPQAGFTGAIWDAVPAETLARELTTGPGAGPMAEAGLAYTELAAVLGAAGTEFRAILAVVGSAWGSDSSEDGLAQLAGLSSWFDTITAAATDNAATAAQQAVSYELAKVAMPPVGEVDQALRSAETMLSGALLGAPLAGLLDLAEQQVDALHHQAAQVMRTYEAAGETLAVPWEQELAPAVSAGANLLAEQARGQGGAHDVAGPAATEQLPTEVLRGPAPTIDLSLLDVTPTPTVVVGGESLLLTPLPTVAPVAPTATAAVSATATTVTAPPPVATPAAPQTATATPQPGARAAAAETGDIGGQIVVDAGFSTAPAVLGAVARDRAEPAAPQALP